MTKTHINYEALSYITIDDPLTGKYSESQSEKVRKWFDVLKRDKQINEYNKEFFKHKR